MFSIPKYKTVSEFFKINTQIDAQFYQIHFNPNHNQVFGLLKTSTTLEQTEKEKEDLNSHMSSI